MAISDYFTMCYMEDVPYELPHEAYAIVAAGAIPYGGAQASKYGSGFRFHLDIPIPAGAIIISATLTLYGHDLGIPSGIGTKAYISGENTNTPVEFTAGDIPTFLTRRANIVPTQIAYDDVSQYYDATPNVLPDISAIIQEIIANGETSDISLFLDDFDNRSTDMHLYLFQPASATLEIVYEADCYVTYDANGGTGTVPVDSTVYDQLDIVTVLGNIDLTKTGYVYSSWNTSADGTGTDYDEGDTFSIIRNTTLYAKWLRNYKANQIVKRGYLNYICIQDHIATADTEPEVGINWELYWRNLTEFFRHNDLLEAQGGTTGQYYHLTSAQNTRVGELEETDSPAFYGVRITSSRGGGLMRTSSIASVNFATDSTPVININIPATSRILGVQLIIDENLTSGYGASSWSASFIGGSTQQICTGVPLTKDLTVDSLAFAIVTTETDIEITANYGSFDTGVITAVCYYETFEDLTPDPV